MARRHLKVRAEFRPGDEEATLVVLEQTHDWDEGFGNSNGYGGSGDNYFFSQTKNYRIGLYCVTCDATVTYDYRSASDKTFWLHFPGKQYAGNRNNTCKIPVDVWPEIKAAIKAYNEWGETQ